MKIPARVQVFDTPVIITDKDEVRLASHLSGWPHLHEMFLLGIFNELDLERLVVLELLGACRREILRRLLARLGTLQRKTIQERIDRCLNAKLKRGS